jgi:hypothetical protein
MPEPTDIREWARQRGHDIGERGRVPKKVLDEYAAEHPAELVDPAAEYDMALPDDMDTGEVPPRPLSRPAATTTPIAGAAETKPKPGKRRLPWQKDQPKDGKPKAPAKRVPLEAWAARGWKMLAYLTGAGVTPTSRCLNMQAPVAGIILDDVIKGTTLDRMAQPLARWGEGGKNMGALVGLPLLVAVTERQPQLYSYTRPLMAEAATEWVLIAGPAMRKAKQRAELVARELAEFEVNEEDIEGAFARAAENPAIAAMLDAIFLPMMHAEPEPAAA